MKKIQLLGMCLTTLFTCSTHAINPIAVTRNVTYNIGDYAQGGVIFWLTPDSQHGIVADIIDLDGGSGIQWAQNLTGQTSAKAGGLALSENYAGSGRINTDQIIAFYGTATPNAALVCAQRSVTMNGVTYDDWYLPSFEEIYMMMTRRDVIDSVAMAHGGSSFATDVYWTSFEFATSSAGTLSFINGASNVNVQKTFLHRVRAARSF
jgi:hypothetical protein